MRHFKAVLQRLSPRARPESEPREERTIRSDDEGSLEHVLVPLPSQAAPAERLSVAEVLVPTDFSATDRPLLRHAARLARAFQAKLVLLHVIDINDPAWFRYAGAAEDFMRHLRAAAVEQMNRLVTGLVAEGVEAESRIVEGLPFEEILHAFGCSTLVLIPPAPAKPFWRLFSKRTSQHLLYEAGCARMLCHV